MSMNFYIRNVGWAVLNPSEAYQARKAMNEYRKQHPVCEITGSDKKVQIHHIVPVWADPTLAADQNNMIALSTQANIHLIFGHNGNYGKRYIKDIKRISQAVQFLLSDADIAIRSDIPAFNAMSTGILSTLRRWLVSLFIR